jgi:hypothetical protein
MDVREIAMASMNSAIEWLVTASEGKVRQALDARTARSR